MIKRLIITTIFLVAVMSLVVWAAVNSTLEDFHMAGTQPNQVTIEGPNRCGNCHGGYDTDVEPYSNWQGSMMARAALAAKIRIDEEGSSQFYEAKIRKALFYATHILPRQETYLKTVRTGSEFVTSYKPQMFWS